MMVRGTGGFFDQSSQSNGFLFQDNNYQSFGINSQEQLTESLKLQKYHDERKQHNPTITSPQSPLPNAPKTKSSSTKKKNKLSQTSNTDIEKILSNFLSTCITSFTTNHQIPSHDVIYKFKDILMENQQLGSETRINLFVQIECLGDTIREYFTVYLKNCYNNMDTLLLEKYFVLKSFKYLIEDIGYSLMKGDESSKYRKTGVLDFDDHISTLSRKKCFLDGGRSSRGLHSSREIIVIDEQKDENLRDLTQTLKQLLEKKFPEFKSAKTLNGSSLLKIFSFISEYVSSYFGGSSKNLVEFSNAHMELLLTREKSKKIRIGDVRIGVCRHRSILFKYLCDYFFVSGYTDIRCRLVRGNVKGGNHAWNVVSIIDSELNTTSVHKFFLVDIMMFPGRLYDIDSVDASTYMRQDFGSIGGHSIRIPNDDISSFEINNKRVLGRGANGKVLSCVVKLPGIGEVSCAVKKIIINSQNRSSKEIKLLTYLSHPNIINFYHARIVKTQNDTQLFIYMELMECNARKFINDFKIHVSKETREYVFEMLYFLINVAKGLVYLHSRNVIHRDVKPENITLKYHANTPKTISKVKLVDFDIANMADKSKTVCGTNGYCDPNFIFSTVPKQASAALDCFSFGVLIAEMFMELSPVEYFAKFPDDQYGFSQYYSIQNIERSMETAYSCIPSSYRQALKEIIADCIRPEEEKRATMPQILSKLENYLLKNYVKKAEENLPNRIK